VTGREAEIRARLEAATPGPWEVQAALGTGLLHVSHADSEVGRPPIAQFAEAADAALIAHAPADLAYLLDRVAALAALAGAADLEAADLRAEVARLTEERDDARESLRVEREDRARTLAVLRDLTGWRTSAATRAAYRHAADLVERGGR
jgi:hypothetical protein